MAGHLHLQTKTLDTHAILGVGERRRPASRSTNDKKMRNKANFSQVNCNKRFTVIISCAAVPGSRRTAGIAKTRGRFFSSLSRVSPSTTPQTDSHHRSQPNGNKFTKQTQFPIIRFDPAAYTQLSQRTGRVAQGSQRPAAFARPACSASRGLPRMLHMSYHHGSRFTARPTAHRLTETK